MLRAIVTSSGSRRPCVSRVISIPRSRQSSAYSLVSRGAACRGAELDQLSGASVDPPDSQPRRNAEVGTSVRPTFGDDQGRAVRPPIVSREPLPQTAAAPHANASQRRPTVRAGASRPIRSRTCAITHGFHSRTGPYARTIAPPRAQETAHELGSAPPHSANVLRRHHRRHQVASRPHRARPPVQAHSQQFRPRPAPSM
jgi:hypothetical protein